jgi:hypothetical protein
VLINALVVVDELNSKPPGKYEMTDLMSISDEAVEAQP